MAQPQGVQKRTLEEIEFEVSFASIDEVVETIDESWGTPAFFSWQGQEFVIDGFRGWCFERFDEDAGKWDPLTDNFETSDELMDLPFLDGKSLRERFSECRFFVES